MKKIILTLLLILIPLWCLAGPLQEKQLMVIAKKNAKLNQTITWNTQPAAMTVGDADQTLNMASASSSLSVTYSTDTTSYCTVVAGALHAVAAGTCVVHADQAGNGTYNAAPRVDSGNVTISAGGYEIADAFGSDTSASYTRIEGDGTAALSVSGGKLHEATAYKMGWWVHNTAISSVSHYVQGKIMIGTGFNDYSGLLARCANNALTGYLVRWDGEGSNNIYLYRCVAASCAYLADYALGGTANQEYLVKLSVSGVGATVTVSVDIDGTNRISYGDTNAARITTGSYIGVEIKRSSDNADVTIDDLQADNL